MTNADAVTIINEIKKVGYKPNEWENAFLCNVPGHRKISKKQSAILLKIYEKATGGGIYQKKQYI